METHWYFDKHYRKKKARNRKQGTETCWALQFSISHTYSTANLDLAVPYHALKMLQWNLAVTDWIPILDLSLWILSKNCIVVFFFFFFQHCLALSKLTVILTTEHKTEAFISWVPSRILLSGITLWNHFSSWDASPPFWLELDKYRQPINLYLLPYVGTSNYAFCTQISTLHEHLDVLVVLGAEFLSAPPTPVQQFETKLSARSQTAQPTEIQH